MSNARVRVGGRLTRAVRGLLLIAENGIVWVVDSDDFDEALIDQMVIVDGTASGPDRLKADWIGKRD